MKPVRGVDWSIVHSVNGFLARHDAIEDPFLAYVQASQALFLGMLVLVCAFARQVRWLGVRRAAVAAGLSAGLGLLITELYVRPRPFVAHPGAVHLFANHATDAASRATTTASVAIAVAILLRSKLRWGLVTLAFALILSFGRVALGFYYQQTCSAAPQSAPQPRSCCGPRRSAKRSTRLPTAPASPAPRNAYISHSPRSHRRYARWRPSSAPSCFIESGAAYASPPRGEALVGPARQILRATDEARDAVSGVLELRTGLLEIAALATLAVDPMATLIGRFRDRHPGVDVRVLEPDSADGVRALVRDGECELGAAHLPLRGEQLTAHPLGEQELLFVFPPRSAPDWARPLGARELAQTPLLVSPPGHLDPHPPRAGACRGRRHAADRRADSRPGGDRPPCARRGQRRTAPGASRRGSTEAGGHHAPARPAITRKVGLVHRSAPLSAAAREFLALATSDSRI